MDVSIVGPKVYYEVPFDFPLLGRFQITETLVVSWLVMLIITLLCIWLTHDLKVENITKRQAFAEMLVEMADKFVIGNMGEKFRYFIPFVAALFATSLFSNLISLLGFRSPTADLNTEAAWAIVVFVLITAQKIKAGGVGGYLKGFTQPIALLTPFNVLSELSTPVSMACRHFLPAVILAIFFQVLLSTDCFTRRLPWPVQNCSDLSPERSEGSFQIYRYSQSVFPQFFRYILTGSPVLCRRSFSACLQPCI